MGGFETFRSRAQDERNREFERIVGKSRALEAVLEQVEWVASTDSTVLLQGETGTGKELIAQAIQNEEARDLATSAASGGSWARPEPHGEVRCE